MKRIILLVGVASSFLLASCSTDANDVELMTSEQLSEKSSTLISPEQAKNATLNFFNSSKKAKSNGIPNVDESNLEEIQTLVNENDEPIIYVLNLKENQGFVVMSASVLERPILAYANEGRFDLDDVADHEGVNDWLMNKFLKISGLEDIGEPWSVDVPNQWNAMGIYIGIGLEDNNGNPIIWEPSVLIDENTEIYGPLLGDIKWGQRNGASTTTVMYNNTVRYNNCSGGIAPAGCVAVAMGQIMKYHNHPNLFNIADMYPYVTSGAPYPHNNINASNIANLLGHIGSNIGMNYSCTRSGAYSQDARTAFNVDYDYVTNQLQGMNLNSIKADVINGKPVYLDGYRSVEVVVTQRPIRLIFRMSIGKTKTKNRYYNGHAWVGDGYQKVTGYFHNPNNNTYFYATIADHVHMNWGWRGSFNGWYDYDLWEDINPIANPGNQTQYIYNQNMIDYITPN